MTNKEVCSIEKSVVEKNSGFQFDSGIYMLDCLTNDTTLTFTLNRCDLAFDECMRLKSSYMVNCIEKVAEAVISPYRI